MPDLETWLKAIALAGAEWEAGCRHPLHDAEEILVTRDGEPEPETVCCPGCGHPRPVRVVNLVVVAG